MKGGKRLGLCFALTAALFTASCGTGSEHSTGKEDAMTNQIAPLIDSNGADPWVLKQGDDYYYTKTTGNNITIFKSQYLTDMGASEGQVIFEPDSDLENLWAPEMHYLDQTWYVYFAANTAGEEMHKMYVLVNKNENPMEGDWECQPVKGMDDKFAIDGTILEADGTRYFIWSGWEGYENVKQDLYIATMISPVEVKQEKILLSQPEYEWEKQGEPLINEGPQIVVKKDTINLLYSASGSWTDDYCLGLLTAPVDGKLTEPNTWIKESQPVFSSGNEVFGPGHNSFTVSPDGTEDYMIYHAARWAGSGWNRSIRLQKITFDETGKFETSQPELSFQLLDVPKGEPKRYRYMEKDFQLSEGLSFQEKDGTISDLAAGGFEDVKDRLTLESNISEDGIYTVIIFARQENCYDEKNVIGLEIEVNGTLTRRELHPSDYYQPLMLKTSLNKGRNEIKVGSEAGGDEIFIDRIEIMPSRE